MSWLETYRGTVYRWEVDNVDHFTVAYYFARFEDATLALLQALGLDPASLAGAGQACVTVECRVGYQRELRVGDILHIRSGVISADREHLAIGHQVFDSGDGALCTTVLQRMALLQTGTRAVLPLSERQRGAAQALRVECSIEAEPARPSDPGGEDGFIDTARDTIKPSEVDLFGQAALPALVHRFSAANGHLIAAFGMTPAYMNSERRGFSTFEFKLRLPGALRAGDLVRVRSALVHVGNSSLRIFHRLANTRTEAVVATLEQAGVHLDLVARRPTALPEPLRERAKAMLVTPAP